MKYIYSWGICFLLLSMGCNIIQQKKIQYKELPTQLSEKKIDYVQSTYQMTWRDSVNFAFKEYTTNDIDDVSYIVGRNSKNGNLVGFNIKSQRKIFSIPDKKLPLSDQHGKINSIYVHNFDSIFITQRLILSLIDSSGRLIRQIPINEGNEKYALGSLHGTSPVFYDDKEQCLYLRSYLWKKKQNSPAYYKANIETSINLETGEIKQLPVTYSKLYRENYYGYANHVFREATDSLHINSFPADPNIYTYNRYTEEYKVIGGKSKYQKQPSATLKWKRGKDKKAKADHFSLTSFYFKMHHDSFRNCYYRFFSPGLPLKNDAGLYNKYIDRKYILMIFDESFRLIEEMEVGKHNVFFTFCTPEGFFVNKVTEKKEKGIYSVFKVDIQ